VPAFGVLGRKKSQSSPEEVGFFHEAQDRCQIGIKFGR